MNRLQLRPIGRTPVRVTDIGFGGAAIGNLYRAVDNQAALDVVDRAHDRGVTYFDTAPLYGLGLSERRIGLALAEKPRESFVLSTKVGRRLRAGKPPEAEASIFDRVPGALPYFDYSYDGVMRSLEESLQRMGLYSIDVLYIHDVDIANHGSVEATERRFREVMDGGGYRAVAELRDQGVVKAIGVGVNEWEWCEKFARCADFDCFLLAGRYTLLEQTALETFLPLCIERGISVVVGGPFNSGILASGPVPGSRYNYVAAPKEILDRAAQLESACGRHGVELAAAALQFPLRHPAVASVIPGTRSIEELDRALALRHTPIPPALWDELKHLRLVRADAPV